MTTFVSILVLIISSGLFEPSPRTGVVIHSIIAMTSFLNKERDSSNTLITANNRSLSRVLSRPALALRDNVVGNTEIAFEITPHRTCSKLAMRSIISKVSSSRIRSYSLVPRDGIPRVIQIFCGICDPGWYSLIDDSTFTSF